MQIKILDGAVNLVNGEQLKMPHTSNSNSPEPFALRFKVKTGLTSFKLSGAFDPTNVTAVDWGRNATIDYTPFSTVSKSCDLLKGSLSQYLSTSQDQNYLPFSLRLTLSIHPSPTGSDTHRQ